MLVVSQFTLYADVRKVAVPASLTPRRRTSARSWSTTLPRLCDHTEWQWQTGQFGAHMVVSLDNDGPVTILIDSAESEAG